MHLSDTQLERYARHIVLREFGGEGQKRLLAAKVLLIGAGGVGSPAALYLAAAGVGTLGIVDDDRVSLSNLQRQILHRTADIGRAKIDSAQERIAALNPDVAVRLHPQRLDRGSAAALVHGYDLVVDGSDNFATRLAVSDACVAEAKPLVSAAIGQFEGQIALFAGHRPGQPCYRCFLPEAPPDEAARSCAEAGVLGAVAGVVGTLAALEAIKALAGVGDTLDGRLMLFDALAPGFRTVRLRRDPACPACGAKAA